MDFWRGGNYETSGAIYYRVTHGRWQTRRSTHSDRSNYLSIYAGNQYNSTTVYPGSADSPRGLGWIIRWVMHYERNLWKIIRKILMDGIG